MALLGPIAVTVGVAGELYVTAISGRIEHGLRASTDLTIANLKTEEAEANARAALLTKQAEQLRVNALLLGNIFLPRHIDFERFESQENLHPGFWNEQLRELEHFSGTPIVIHSVA